MTIIVLVPDILAFAVYMRTPGGRMQRAGWVALPDEIPRWLPSYPGRVVVVLVGCDFVNQVADKVLPQADLVVVPLPWLRNIPSRATARRAIHAARIATTYLHAPLDVRFAQDDDEIPF